MLKGGEKIHPRYVSDLLMKLFLNETFFLMIILNLPNWRIALLPLWLNVSYITHNAVRVPGIKSSIHVCLKNLSSLHLYTPPLITN